MKSRAGLDFLILGELVVRCDGHDLPLPGRAVRSLLGALLLTPGEVVGDMRLLELTWGVEEGSRRALQCAVSRLRNWLREHTRPCCHLERAGSGYRLDVPPQSVDITRFHESAQASMATGDPERRLMLLSAALAEWRSPVLGGHLESLTTDPVVRTVEQARIDCACALADVASRLGRPAEVVAAVSVVAAAAPYDEPLQARLVRLLSACGRHAEALRCVERVRQRLADDLGVAPSGEVSSAHAAVLQGTGRSPPPAQLPPDVADFTGRRPESEAVGGLLLPAGGGPPGAVAIGVITGAAGVGKSALAVHVAHRVAAAFPDGQLYADLRTVDACPIDPADVLGRFLRALGVAALALPDALAERVALYRSLTAGRKLLVLLDNALTEAQVRPLVPGSAGCAVLVTGRTALAGLAGARLVHLGALLTAEAVQLLGSVCRRAGATLDPAAQEIVRLCAGLPLAVRIAGSRLAARPQLSLGRLAARLRDEDRRLDELHVDGLGVRPCLDLSYRALDPALRQTFRYLGLLRAGAFPSHSTAALLDTSLDAATAHLEALVDARLLDMVEEEPAGEVRYGFSDLVRLYARERARDEDPPAARDAALRRVYGAR